MEQVKYYKVFDRAVKIIPGEGDQFECFVFDSKKDDFVLDYYYFVEMCGPSAEVDDLTKEEFDAYVEELRQRRRMLDSK